MKQKFKCPVCGHTWTWSWLRWVWEAPIHNFGERRTQCPECKFFYWTKGEKQ